ncbi:MAG TPA: hypothetical protein VJR89_10065, partial [Polyangiales bacterium]|nr:hypothetical protein [Polyangiales bacterium]
MPPAAAGATEPAVRAGAPAGGAFDPAAVGGMIDELPACAGRVVPASGTTAGRPASGMPPAPALGATAPAAPVASGGPASTGSVPVTAPNSYAPRSGARP